jgi:glucoamylase
LEVWKSNRQVQIVSPGTLLRIQANSPFLLHWTSDDWQCSTDLRSQGTEIGIEFVDIPLPEKQKNPIQFTFLWLDEDRWEGKDYIVNVREEEATAHGNVDHRRGKKAQGKSERPATVG